MFLKDFFKNKILFLTIILFVFCEKNNIINNKSNDKFLLIEVKRYTEGLALSDTCGNVHIDFGGYHYDDKEMVLHVYRVLDTSFSKYDPVKIIYCLERSLGGDLGGGVTGGILPRLTSTDTLEIMTYPLLGQDTLVVSNFADGGIISFIYKKQNFKVNPNSSLKLINSEVLTTALGKFEIYDSLSIINQGFLNQNNIRYH